MWEEFIKLEEELSGSFEEKFIERFKHYNMPSEFTEHIMHPSPYLNIYAYPEELDYLDIRPLPAKWQRFDHFIRMTEKDSSFSVPEDFLAKPLGKLIYFSLGSMGCADIDLMTRLITQIFAHSPNRFILSLGPEEAKLRKLLGENMWGARFVPQMSVLPLVDLVITHGGNNTTLESLYHGKPVLVTPLFGDQRDNAQRVTECGYGGRIKPYTCESEEFLELIEELLGNQKMRQRVLALSARMQASNSTEKAAWAIESLAYNK